MTALPEAKLAREAEICYGVIGCVTDYDSWHEQREAVTVKIVLDILAANIQLARNIVRLAVGRLPAERHCDCASALQTAIVTAPDRIPADLKEKVRPIIGKYIRS
jgi:5'-methylthioadenosine phosphorylase